MNLFEKKFFFCLLSFSLSSCVTGNSAKEKDIVKASCSVWNEETQKKIARDLVKMVYEDSDFLKRIDDKVPIHEVSSFINSTGQAIEVKDIANYIYDELLNTGKIRFSITSREKGFAGQDIRKIKPNFISHGEVFFSNDSYHVDFGYKTLTGVVVKILKSKNSCSL